MSDTFMEDNSVMDTFLMDVDTGLNEMSAQVM